LETGEDRDEKDEKSVLITQGCSENSTTSATSIQGRVSHSPDRRIAARGGIAVEARPGPGAGPINASTSAISFVSVDACTAENIQFQAFIFRHGVFS